jgi:TRAP-type C4-dicarboxylate transport system permease small subunit
VQERPRLPRGHAADGEAEAVDADAAHRVDLLCLAFCGMFAWKSWTLLHEAWVDKQTTSSSWAPPLWIPYLLMSFGMTLLALQLLVHVAASVNRARLVAAEER